MKLAVRFRFYKPVEPSMHIVDMKAEQWREFLLFEDNEKRMKYLLRFLGKSMDLDIKEMWWIPLDGQKDLTISKKAEIVSRESMRQTQEELMREMISAYEKTKKSIEDNKALLEERSRETEKRLEELKAHFRSQGYIID